MRFTEIKPLSEDTLLEINMSPSALRKMSSNIPAQVGMEFELYLPDVSGEDDDDEGSYTEPEPDYEADESVHTIDQIVDFFKGDHNSSSEIRSLEARLTDRYHSWLDSDLDERWESVARKHIIAYLKDNFTDEIKSQARSEVTAKNPKATDDEILKRAREIGLARLDAAIDDKTGNPDWDKAKIEWTQDDTNDEENQKKFLNDQEGFHTMRDVMSEYDINWPVWTESEYYEPERNGRSLEEVAEDFYHKTGFRARKGMFSDDPPIYGVDYDGSLTSPDSGGDHGVEFSSPPFEFGKMINHLNAFKKFAESEGGYTNSTCGLHISVSVYKSESDAYGIDGLDYVKLAVLLGDKHVLDQFGRYGSRYCASALDIVKTRINQRPNDMKSMLDKMKSGLETFASRLIHSGTTDKFTSINNKGDYIEFRSAGNDWLNPDFFDKIENTTMRYIVALDAAMDPKKFQKEYASKLATMLTGGKQIEYYDPKDPANAKFPTVFSDTKKPGWVPGHYQDVKTIDYLAQYVAGTLSERDMKTFKELVADKTTRPPQTYAPLPDRKIPIPQPTASDVPTTSGSGKTKFYLLSSTNRLVHTMFADTQGEANRLAAEWLRSQNLTTREEWSVVPVQASAPATPTPPRGIEGRVGYYVVPTNGGDPIGSVYGATSEEAWASAVSNLRELHLDPMNYMIRQAR